MMVLPLVVAGGKVALKEVYVALEASLFEAC